MSDEVGPITATLWVEDTGGSKSEATIAFSYSLEGLMQLRESNEFAPLSASLFVTSWDIMDDDGSPLPLDADIPIRVFNALLDAAVLDMKRRYPGRFAELRMQP